MRAKVASSNAKVVDATIDATLECVNAKLQEIIGPALHDLVVSITKYDNVAPYKTYIDRTVDRILSRK